MKKVAYVVIGVLALLLFSNVVMLAAGAPDNGQKLSTDTSNDDQKITVPDEWHDKDKVVIPHGDLVQVVYIKHKDEATTATNDPIVQGSPWGGTDIWPSDGISTYYNAYDVSPYRWQTTGIKYTINPSTAVRNYRLSQNDVKNAITNSFETWDKAIAPQINLYDSNGVTMSSTARASLNSPDYKNVITWASISNHNIVAMSNMWYRTSDNRLVDCDIVFNTYFKWGIGSSTGKYDIQDICTHEVGHWTGLNDIYDGHYTPMTMYGYASFGETYKRSLEPGDVTGVNVAY